MATDIEIHTSEDPVECAVLRFDHAAVKFATLKIGVGETVITLYGSIERSEAMERAALAINEAFGVQSVKEAAE